MECVCNVIKIINLLLTLLSGVVMLGQHQNVIILGQRSHFGMTNLKNVIILGLHQNDVYHIRRHVYHIGRHVYRVVHSRLMPEWPSKLMRPWAWSCINFEFFVWIFGRIFLGIMISRSS